MKAKSYPMLALFSTVAILVYIIFILNKTLSEKIKMIIALLFISIIGIFNQEYLFYTNIFVAVALYTNRPEGNKKISELFSGFGSTAKKETEKPTGLAGMSTEQKQELINGIVTGKYIDKDNLDFNPLSKRNLAIFDADYWKFAIWGDKHAYNRLIEKGVIQSND